MRKRYQLFLVTLRNNRTNLLWQLNYFAINKFFDKVLSRDNNAGTWQVKYELIVQARLVDREKLVIIGDTEADVLTAKELNAISIAVESGIRNKEFLQKLQPDFLLKNISELGRIDLG